MGGIVCGSLEVLCFKIFLPEYGGTFFLEKMLIPDLILLMNFINVRLVCKYVLVDSSVTI